MSYSDTANAIRAMARQYAGIVQAADMLDKFGSLEQAVKEAQSAQVAAEQARQKAQEELKIVDDELEAQKRVNADNLKLAQDEAAAIVAKADNYARESTEQAVARATRIEIDAKAYAVDVRAEVERELVTYRVAKASADSEFNAVSKRIDSAQAELDAINSKLDAARAAYQAALK